MPLLRWLIAFLWPYIPRFHPKPCGVCDRWSCSGTGLSCDTLFSPVIYHSTDASCLFIIICCMYNRPINHRNTKGLSLTYTRNKKWQVSKDLVCKMYRLFLATFRFSRDNINMHPLQIICEAYSDINLNTLLQIHICIYMNPCWCVLMCESSVSFRCVCVQSCRDWHLFSEVRKVPCTCYYLKEQIL